MHYFIIDNNFKCNSDMTMVENTFLEVPRPQLNMVNYLFCLKVFCKLFLVLSVLSGMLFQESSHTVTLIQRKGAC